MPSNSLLTTGGANMLKAFRPTLTGTLMRGASSTANVPFRYGASTEEDMSDVGIVISILKKDLLIDKTEYKIGGVAVEPANGDKFQPDGDSRVFETIGNSFEKCWRWHERAELTYRIHTNSV